MNAFGLPVEAAKKIITLLAKRGKVLIMAEGELREEFRQYQFPLPSENFHDVLAFASMVIGDSQTVTAEAAVLGVPNLRCNSFVGRITYLEELEKIFGLTKGFLPGDADKLIHTVQDYLENSEKIKHEMQRRRTKMLASCVNVADWQWDMISENIF
jgi:predicted glycosyltransferase